MENIYAMIERIESLNEIKEQKRIEAAKRLQREICAFVAHIGHSYVYECPYTGLSYELLDDGTILAKDEDSNKEQGIEVKDLYLEEMEHLHEHIVEVLSDELHLEEDEIGRYQNLCL